MKKKIYINNFVFIKDGYEYYFVYNKYRNNKNILYNYLLEEIIFNNKQNIVLYDVKTKIRNGKIFIIDFEVDNNLYSTKHDYKFKGAECKDNFGHKFFETNQKKLSEILKNNSKIKKKCDHDICNDNSLDLRKILDYFKKCTEIDCDIYGHVNDIFIDFNGLFKSNIYKFDNKNFKIVSLNDIVNINLYLQYIIDKNNITKINSEPLEKNIKNIIKNFYNECEELNIDPSKLHFNNFLFKNLLTSDELDLNNKYYISFFDYSFYFRNGKLKNNKNKVINGVREIKIQQYDKNKIKLIDNDHYIILKDNIDNFIYSLTLHKDYDSAKDSLEKKIYYFYKLIKNIEGVING